MFNSSPTTCSFGFGQSASFASPFGSQPGFGANTSLSNPNSFAPSGATPFGTSTAATMFAGNSTTGAAAFGQPAISSSPFGPTSVFGQTTGSYATATPRVSTSTGLAMPSANSTGFGQLTNSSPFGSQSVVFRQGSNSSNNNYFGTAATPFATSTGGSMFSGNSTGAFGASSFAFGSSASPTNLPFSATFGTSAVSSTVFSQSPSSASVVSRSVFGDVNKFGVNNSFSSKPVTATSFGSINAGAIFGGNSAGSFGVASSPSTSKSSFGAPLPFSIGVSTATTGSWERKQTTIDKRMLLP